MKKTTQKEINRMTTSAAMKNDLLSAVNSKQKLRTKGSIVETMKLIKSLSLSMFLIYRDRLDDLLYHQEQQEQSQDSDR